MFLYRIVYVSASEARSVVRRLGSRPAPGDEIPLDPRTVVTVKKVIPRDAGDTIAAEVIAEASDGLEKGTVPADPETNGDAPAEPATRLPVT